MFCSFPLEAWIFCSIIPLKLIRKYFLRIFFINKFFYGLAQTPLLRIVIKNCLFLSIFIIFDVQFFILFCLFSLLLIWVVTKIIFIKVFLFETEHKRQKLNKKWKKKCISIISFIFILALFESTKGLP